MTNVLQWMHGSMISWSTCVVSMHQQAILPVLLIAFCMHIALDRNQLRHRQQLPATLSPSGNHVTDRKGMPKQKLMQDDRACQLPSAQVRQLKQPIRCSIQGADWQEHEAWWIARSATQAYAFSLPPTTQAADRHKHGAGQVALEN